MGSIVLPGKNITSGFSEWVGLSCVLPTFGLVIKRMHKAVVTIVHLNFDRRIVGIDRQSNEKLLIRYGLRVIIL